MTDASRNQDAPGTSHGATDTGAGLPDWRPERSTARWRLGSRNPFTVYRVADGAHDVDHAREHFVTSFRREEDARRAVDAVNAQAGPHEDGLSPWATYRFDPNVRVRGVQTYTGYEDRLHGEAPRRGKTIRLVEIESGMTVDGVVTETNDDKQLIYVAVDWSRLTVPDETPPACDCPDTDGAAHLTLVSNPDRVGGQVTVGHTRWRLEAAAETVRAGDPLDAWVPEWVSREQAELLERLVAVLDGDEEGEEGEEVRSWQGLADELAGNAAHAKERFEQTRKLSDMDAITETGRGPVSWLSLSEGYDTAAARIREVGPRLAAGSAVGQRGAPTRDALVAQFDDALFYNGPDGASVFRWLDGRFTPADEPMLAGLAERMADVALAALRDGGADTGGEDEGAVHWTKEEVKRARERMATVPPHARPLWTPGSFGDRCRGATARPPSRCANCGRDLEDVCAAVAGGGLACSAGCADTAAVVNTLRKLNAEPAEDESPAEAVYEAVQWARKGKRDAQAAIARLSTALGVSLDPDDPDPVGRLVEAAGKAREVEVVSGAEATELPTGSRIVLEAGEYRLTVGVKGINQSYEAEGKSNSWNVGGRAKVVVLYRAPAPAPAALAVGEVVESAADLDRRASVGTIVEDEGGQLGKLNDVGAWSPHQAHLDYPVTVVRVGTGGGETGE